MDKKQVIELGNKLVRSKNFTDTLFALYDRWEDEKMYEDWKDYEKAMREIVKNNTDIENPKVKGTKRPFGVKIEIGDLYLHIHINIKNGWMRVGGKVIPIKKG